MYVPPFVMSKFPVTRKQYWLAVQCCVVGPHPDMREVPDFRTRDLPVTDITFAQARAFARWVGGDLPTVIQWEYVAMNGEERRLFPWGNDLEEGRIPRTHASAADIRRGVQPVGSWPEGSSVHGVHDLCGNVFEWCLDPFEEPTAPSRVIKGGCYYSSHHDCQNSTRIALDSTLGYSNVGFRIVWANP